MTGFDYDVLIIGSGFGGSVAALRAAEKGYRVGVMESGRRWADQDIPKTQSPGFLWFPGAELYGIQRIEYLDDVLVLCKWSAAASRSKPDLLRPRRSMVRTSRGYSADSQPC